MIKYLTFAVTAVAYMTLHMMRMSLPFISLSLMHFFHINKFQMGIANASLYILIGLSYLWRALTPIKLPQFTYFWSMGLASLSFLIIPLLIYIQAHVTALFFISLAGFGWFQSGSWPLLLSIVHTYFHPKRDGCMLGLWSSSADFGNIFGFMMCTLVIYTFKLPFQVCLIISGVAALLMAFAVFQLKTDHDPLEDNQIPDTGYTTKIIAEYKSVLNDRFIVFMIVILCMLKALLYGILLWLPMYFEQSGFKQFQGYIPITMQIMAIFGSVVLGLIFQKVKSKAVRSTVFMLTLLLTVACVYVVKSIQFTIQNQVVFLILIAVIGFCVMGNYNILSAHEVSAACQAKNISIAAFASLVMAFGNIFVGIIQFVIGKFATSDSNSVFLIFFIMSIILVALEIVRTVILWKNKVSQEHLSQSQSKKSSQIKNIEKLKENDEVSED